MLPKMAGNTLTIFGNTLTIFRHTFWDILLPTSDVLGDINFAVSAFLFQKYDIGCLMLLPVALNMAFQFYKWFTGDHDTQKGKRFTWLLLVLNLWPQYQVVKLISLILRGKGKAIWEPVQDKIKKDLLFMEPLIEAIPEFFVSFTVFSMLLDGHVPVEDHGGLWGEFGMSSVIWNGNTTVIKDVFGDQTLGISNNIMFPLKVLVSALRGVKSMVEYLSNGPLQLTSDTECGKLVVLTSMGAYVVSSFIGKSLYLWLIVGAIEHLLKGTHGIVGFLIAFILFIAFPMIISIGPLARVVGFRKSGKMYLIHPEILMLSLITEYVPGPSCWYTQRNHLNANEISISRSISWNRMFYNQVIFFFRVYPFCIVHIYRLCFPDGSDESIKSRE